MKKNNNRGFMLIETLICSTFIVGILIVLYTQFERINKSYEDSFKYNTVNNLYLVNNFKMYLLQNGGESLLNNLNSTNYFIDITACPSPLQEVNYCNNLIKDLNIKQIIFSSNDLNTKIKDQDITSPSLLKFIKNVKLVNSGYVIYVEFNDKTFAIAKVF